MEGVLRALQSSCRGLVHWMDVLGFPRGFPPPQLGLACAEGPRFDLSRLSISEENDEEGGNPSKWSGILWGVPKKRTSIMKRIRRKFGHPDWGSPLLKPKTNLRICDNCGHYYEAFHLCGNCYERIKKETQLIREQIDAKVGDGPVDRDVVVLYENEAPGEKVPLDRILVEFPKPRPSWFSGNLLQRTTLRVNPDAVSVVPTPEKPVIKDEKKD